jgi:hypothetical protein
MARRLYRSWEWVISLRDEYGDATDQDYADQLDNDWMDLVKDGWEIELNLNYGTSDDGHYHRFYATLDPKSGELAFPDNWPEGDKDLTKKIKKQIERFVSQ